MIIPLILFILTYILMLKYMDKKHIICIISACIFILLNIISCNRALKAIDYNVLLMIFGIMGTVNLFIESKMPSLLADKLIKRTNYVKYMYLLLAIFAGIISAFIDNVATVLIVAPIAIEVSKKLKISPVPILISVSIFSNLEGAATLVGDTTSILLANTMGLNFLDFFIYQGHIGLFFIIQVSLIFASLVLLYKFKDYKQRIVSNENIKVYDYFPTFLLLINILSLIIVSFIPNKPNITNGVICVIFYILGLIRNYIKNHDLSFIKKQITNLDYQTIILLASLFIIISAIKEVGIIDKLGNIFINISDSNIFILYTIIVLFSCIISAFVDNIPYVATMLNVVSTMPLSIDKTILYYGLIIGSTLGGNLTPIGASANVTSIGILNKNGYKVSLKEYLSYSIPITFISLLSGYILVYLILGK